MSVKRKIRMALLLSLIFVILTSIGNIRAFEPIPMAFVDKNIFSGIIPLSDNDLDVKKSAITIDFLSDNVLTVDSGTERKAKVTISYDIFNPGNMLQMRMAFPFLSCFKYLPEAIETKVDGLSISNKLEFSKGDLLPDRDFQRYLNNFTAEEYQQTLISDYQNEKDLNGYLYTVVNPETRGSNFYAGTKLFFHDVPEDILFVDCNPGFNNEINDQRETAEMHYASGETVYFFVDRDLIVTSISNEFERKDGVGCIGYIGNGVVLEPAKITKSPIKLIDYINLYKNDDLYGSYDGPYKQELRSYFYTRFDEAMTFPYNANLEAEMRLARETFQLMAVEFEASLEAQTNTVIELSFLSPVFFDYGDHYRKINVMEFEPNPADRWKQIEDIEFTVLTGDKIFETALPFVEVDNGYRLKLIEEPSQAISISIDNSSDGSNRFGCGCASVTVYNVMWAMAVLMISALILRKR